MQVFHSQSDLEYRSVYDCCCLCYPIFAKYETLPIQVLALSDSCWTKSIHSLWPCFYALTVYIYIYIYICVCVCVCVCVFTVQYKACVTVTFWTDDWP